ncbi:energy transducer TonB [Salegentibacter salegens]|uniref:TonB family C-terminal domain-containing protein n=1 Tax=Salegentibacter salegens TaxID=143223 RepID=A0A1M7P056_9FLAO|nr:energy transducer TonB [Salegentibacter salegens]PRX46358.1 TonB family protein [Salegentibacter salegens]SHN09821.1 TonB family C-terminal domain-containing protein [Salegentibacter salegens]
MKNLYLSLIFTVISFSAFAQDTIYMDNKYQDLDTKEGAEYFKIITPTPDQKYDFLRTTYFIDGTKKAEHTYDLRGKTKVYDGLHKQFYKSGELFYQLPFKNGKKHGTLIAYWENGDLRRKDVFKRDKLKKGQVWNEKGEEIEYFEYHIPASYPGGEKRLYSFLQENINIPQEHDKDMEVKVVLMFTINPDGDLSEIKIVDGAPHRYNAEAVRVLTKMPKWNPTKRFGEPIATRYALPIIFRK